MPATSTGSVIDLPPTIPPAKNGGDFFEEWWNMRELTGDELQGVARNLALEKMEEASHAGALVLTDVELIGNDRATRSITPLDVASEVIKMTPGFQTGFGGEQAA